MVDRFAANTCDVACQPKLLLFAFCPLRFTAPIGAPCFAGSWSYVDSVQHAGLRPLRFEFISLVEPWGIEPQTSEPRPGGPPQPHGDLPSETTVHELHL